MKARVCRLLTSLRALLVRGISLLIEQSESSMDPTLSDSIVERFATRHLLVSLLWGLGSSLTWDRRQELGDVILKNCHITLPGRGGSLLEYTVNVSDGEWVEWASLVPQAEVIESHRVVSADVVVTTTDTVRHVEVLKGWLGSHRPLILCGPPGMID
jgi:dynein heavy chain 1, cytosolic